jgi:hypothetical protein
MNMGGRSIEWLIRLMAVCAVTLSWAQTSTTSLRGTVSDPKGAVVPAVEVMIVNPATGFTRTTKTDEQGFYQFLEVPPATYTVSMKAPGFGIFRVDNVRLLVNTPATLNETLRMQTVAETIDVMSQAPLVNTEDASIGHAFTADQMTTLPFEGRDPVSILSLQPGVLYTGSSTDIHPDADSRSGAVSGARSDQTNITVDGLDNNDPVLGYAFQGALRSTLDSLEEFRVTTTNSNPDSGRSSGAQVSLVTKSGTNSFHGSLYEYNRSKIGEANNWFNERSQLLAGQPNVPPHLVRNTFGGSIGGPIIKSRLFFFATYEGQRTHETAVVTRFVPTASFRSGLLTYQCDNGGLNTTCPPSGLYTLNKTNLANLDPFCQKLGNCPQGPGIDPAALAVFNTFPLPNDPTVGDGLNVSGYTFADPTPAKLDTYIVKLDYNLTANGNHRVFLRGNLQNDHLTTEGAQFPGQAPAQISTNNGKGLAAGYTSIISNTLINNFGYGYIREGLANAGLQNSGFIGFYAGGISNPSAETPTTNVQVPLNNFVDDLSWTKGKHSLQFGTNVRIINNLRQSNAQSFITGSSNPTWLLAGGISGTNTSLDPGAPQFQQYGFPEVSGSFTASYDLGATAITGMVPEITADYQMTKNFTLLPEGAMVARHFRAHEAEWYAQDAWRVKPNLTLTFGLRYSLLQPPYETTGTQVSPNPGIHQWFRNRYMGMAQGQSIQPLLSFSLSGQANGKPPIWNWDYKDIAPRFAFAWSPNFSTDRWLGKIFGNSGKSSIRGGYGMYYDHFGEGVMNSFDRMGSFGLTTIIGDPAGLVTPDQSPRFSSLYDVPKSYFACANGGNPPCQTQQFLLQPPAPTGGFPYQPPSTPTTGGESISWGMDDGLRTPYSHVVDLSFTRDLGRGFVLESSYVGRFGHRLLQQLDVAQPMNLRDPKSGTDLYTATRMIAAATQANLPVQNLGKIPYFENIFPKTAGAAALAALQNNGTACAPGTPPANPTATQNMYQLFSCNGGVDMTTELLQADWYCVPACATVGGVTQPFQFWAPQFSSLYVWSTMGNSSYNALQASLRRKMAGGLQFDFNYTYSKSIDLGSDAERVNQYEGGTGVAGGGFASYIMNTWSPNQNRAVSDFDATHQFNANWMYQLPVGKGKRFAPHGALGAILGNWELTGIFRMTSGFPTTVNDGNYWPTNWENTANSILVGPKPASGTFTVNGSPNLFKNPCCGTDSAINQFRFALPGEGGERNLIRGAGYFGLDMGLGKVWNITESSALRFSWETFNITNAVRFDAAALEPIAGSNASGNLSLSNSSSFGYYTSTLTAPRVMQFALRYSF